MLAANDYQRLAARTVNPAQDWDARVANFALGLAGESGEVVDEIKKVLYHDKTLDLDTLGAELGDVAWYLSQLCLLFGLDFEQVLLGNLRKLQARYPNGFGETEEGLDATAD